MQPYDSYDGESVVQSDEARRLRGHGTTRKRLPRSTSRSGLQANSASPHLRTAGPARHPKDADSRSHLCEQATFMPGSRSCGPSNVVDPDGGHRYVGSSIVSDDSDAAGYPEHPVRPQRASQRITSLPIHGHRESIKSATWTATGSRSSGTREITDVGKLALDGGANWLYSGDPTKQALLANSKRFRWFAGAGSRP